MLPIKDHKEFSTVREIGQLLGLSSSTIYKAIERKDLTHYKFGGHVRVAQTDLEQWIGNHKYEKGRKI